MSTYNVQQEVGKIQKNIEKCCAKDESQRSAKIHCENGKVHIVILLVITVIE